MSDERRSDGVDPAELRRRVAAAIRTLFPRIDPLPAPGDREIALIAARIARRLAYRFKQRELGPNDDLCGADPPAEEESWLAALAAASVRGRIAIGPQAGQLLLKRGDRVDVFEPLEFIANLAAIVPAPRVHLVRYHGVLAPGAPGRDRIVPQPEGAEVTSRSCAQKHSSATALTCWAAPLPQQMLGGTLR